MAPKLIAYFLLLGFVAQLCPFGYPAIEPSEAGDALLKQATVLTAPVPEKGRFTPVSFLPVMVRGEMIGRVAVFDDPATKRPADYIELYNSTGDLLAINWFDRFGIERLVVDRGVLQGTGRVEKVFVAVLEGEAI
jgi:hypothetical protein